MRSCKSVIDDLACIVACGALFVMMTGIFHEYECRYCYEFGMLARAQCCGTGLECEQLPWDFFVQTFQRCHAHT